MAGTLGGANSAHFDGNQVPTIMGVIGSAGTADTKGTALPLPVGVNEPTGALYVYNLGPAGNVTVAGTDPTSYLPARLTDGTTFYAASGGAGGGTFVNVSTGTQQTLGTVGIVNTGTLAQVTVVNSVSEMVKGTTTLVTRMSNLGTLELGSVVVTTLPSGGTILNLATGTLAAVTTVTTLSNLTNGSVNILTGTLQSSGTTTGVGVVSNLTNGSVNVLTGTVTSVTNLAGGTIRSDFTPVNVGTPINAIGTTAAAVWGTLVSTSGNGIKQYVSGVYIVVTSGTVDVAVTNIGIGGSTGAGVLARGQFQPGGGIQRAFNPNIASGTGGTIAYWLGGAGTVSVGVDYWQGA